MDYNHFKVTIDQNIAQVAINRPAKANSLHMDAWTEMKQIFKTLSITDSVRVIILSGEGNHFCSGID